MGLVPRSAGAADVRFGSQPGLSERVHQMSQSVYVHFRVPGNAGRRVLLQDVLPADDVQREGGSQKQILRCAT